MAARVSEMPRIRVAALMTIDGRIVVVRHRAGTTEYHLLPGGGVDYRETVGDALVREVREETGLVATVGEPLIVSDTIDPNGSRHVVNVVMSARITGGEITSTPEDDRVVAVDLVTPDELLTLDLRPPMAADVVAVLAEGASARPRYLGSLFVER
ncbi:MAG TPA: NUDIX hydrolase [Coriobacteriia bacterium]|nr:NUDIX hydrolase [Coriobacteriia bacterium]